METESRQSFEASTGGFLGGALLVGGGGGCAGIALGDVAHEFDGADAAVEAVLEHLFGAGTRKGAEAVGDGSDLDAVEEGVRFGCRGEAGKLRSRQARGSRSVVWCRAWVLSEFIATVE